MGTDRDMFDTMTLTKTGGALFGSLLCFLLIGWAGDAIYSVNAPGHGEGEHTQAFIVPVEGAEPAEGAAEEPAEDPVALFAAAWPAADPAAGEDIFKRRCSSCHMAEAGENRTGPYLHGVVGRPVASIADFANYSGALQTVFDVWTPENMNIFILNPKGAVADTGMVFNGLDDAQDRADLIAYLDSLDA